MKGTGLTFLIILWVSLFGYCQDKALFVVDSIPVFHNPNPELNNLKARDIYSKKVISDPKTLNRLGFGDYEQVDLIITKSFHERPDSVRKIPSVNVMENKNGVWYLANKAQPYSGPFINYYLSGDKYGEGTFKNGKLDGRRKMYYDNGNLKLNRIYTNGLENGPSSEFYEDGTLKQQGDFVDGKENGLWEMYYPNGQLKQRATFVKGKIVGDSYSYYSTGRLKMKATFVDGRAQYDDDARKVQKLYNEGFENAQLGNLHASINSFTKCIELSPDYAEAYFARGTARLNNLEFDEAKGDFDKAIELEPYYIEAYANRAFCLIRKHQLENSKNKSTKNGSAKGNAKKDDTQIPEKDLEIICSDLHKTISMGNNSLLVRGAYKDYCE